jgi:lantibiotic biosynthesis protein
MRSRNDRRWYRCVDAALLRATVQQAESELALWPTPEGARKVSVERWAEWLRLAWADPQTAESIEIASPVLASRVEAVIGGAEVDDRRARRMALAVARYLLRAGSRATPYGLFAGVAPAGFAAAPEVRFARHHWARLRPDTQWLHMVIADLESDAELLTRLPVTANTLCRAIGDRLRIPATTGVGAAAGLIEVSLRLTPAVAFALDVAKSPVRCGDLTAKLAAEFPAAPPEKVGRLIAQLVARRALISALCAPSTEPDPLGHMLAQLDAHCAGGLPHVALVLRALRDIHTRMEALSQADVGMPGRASRAAVVDRMRELAPASDAQPAVDLRLDARIALPYAVAHEVEAAASVLVRLATYPHGSASWLQYAERFVRRYGSGTLVPVVELTDPVVGLGFPAGYPGSAPEPLASSTVRDERLLACAQWAALEGVTEVALTDAMVTYLQADLDSTRVRIPPHVELNVQVYAESVKRLAAGEFGVRVLGVSRAVATMTGRFLPLLEPADRERMVEVIAGLPTVDRSAVAVQLSFPPLCTRADHVVRASRILPSMISLGEYPDPGAGQIPLADLAVGCGDDNRLYLVALSSGRVVEAMVPTSLNYRNAAKTPPIGRFLAEVARAGVAQVTGFDWGAARSLPFLPALRYGRTVLIPARWRLTSGELPSATAAGGWTDALHEWCQRRRVPARVLLAEGDQQLLLNLDQDGPLELLRVHLARAGRATLVEAPSPEGYGWIGGRTHSVVVPLVSSLPPASPAAPPPTALIRHRNLGEPPGISSRIEAELFVHPDVQDQMLVRFPRLLASFDPDVRWWFGRECAPEPLVRLCVALSSAGDFGPAASALGAWAVELRAEGLLREFRLTARSPRPGRWGTGEALEAAERVFRADSRVVIAQLAASESVGGPALAAANFAALASGFIGMPGKAMRWLVDHARPEPSPPPILRNLYDEAVRLADPTGDFTTWVQLFSGDFDQAASWWVCWYRERWTRSCSCWRWWRQ